MLLVATSEKQHAVVMETNYEVAVKIRLTKKVF